MGCPSRIDFAHVSRRLAVVAMALAVACGGGGSGEEDDNDPSEGWTDTWETGRNPGTTAGDTDGGTDGDTGDAPPETTCEELSVGGSQIRRLTATEYERTVADLFGTPIAFSTPLPGDNGALGFDNQAAVQEISAPDVLAWEGVAEEISVAATADLATLVGCDLAGADEDNCLDTFVRGFGRRAFRRPLTDAEVTKYTAFYQTQRAQEEPQRAVQLLVKGLLMSPHFLYLIEPGNEQDATALDDYAVASRLSYFLWKTMPDDALMQAADAGELGTIEQIEAQARRLIDDPRAADAVTDFYVQWAGAQSLAGIAVPDGFDPSLSEDGEREIELFVRDWFQSGGLAGELLTSTKAFVTPELADYYGIGAGQGQLDASTHAGLLTRMAFVGTHTIPPSRGDFILGKVLCRPLTVPPFEIPDPPEGAEYPTQRDRFEAHAALECATACHSIMDPLGFAFEHYDATGRWRDFDNGHPVDAATEVSLPGLDDLNGPVDGAIELSSHLADSDAYLQCQTEQWFTYAYNRPPTPDDECVLETMQSAFIAAGGDPRELLVQLSTSDAMRFVRKKEPAQ
jgi:hypothetical protein